jgi:predicted ATPase
VEQPSGTVTLVFTDIEGSTRLLEELGQEAYRVALGEHRRVVREAFARFEGYEVDYEGDAFFYAFASAQAAVGAVGDAMGGLDGGPIRVRVGIHTGEPGLDPPKYVGRDVHLAARVMSAGHGGQVLLSQATRRLVEVQAVDLGEHRLKDFAAPVSLFQLGVGSFPPLKTISNTNLPRPASSFVGREREVTEVVELVRGGARLVTLIGPGGSGKTLLGIEAAAELVPGFRAGVFWVGLATLRDPALVLETIGQTLGAKDEPAVHIGERELLLLLDNLEQVVEAAPELAALVEACPNLVLLVTSRELLRVRGEVEYQVLPLAAPDAVELFCARARVEPSAAVDELCRRLDNMPLALELAAARAAVLTVDQMLERLSQRLDLFKGGRDSDPRQQTLRATIEWSYELLSPEEQRLFVALSVFAGGCTLEAAEKVAEACLDALQSLVEKSLLRRSDGRFWLLETIREFAAECLDASEHGPALYQRHAQYFLALAEAKGVKGAFDLHFEDLGPEHDNFRQALAVLQGGTDFVELRLAGALARFWYRGGHLREGLARLEGALARAEDPPPAIACNAHGLASAIAEARGDLTTAEFHAQAELDVARRSGSSEEVADALISLGCAASGRGDLAAARRHFEASLELARADRSAGAIASALSNLTSNAMYEGDFDRAAELAEEAIETSSAAGWIVGQAVGRIDLALVWLSRGRIDDAALAMRDAAHTIPATGFSTATADWLEAAGETLRAKGDDRVAAKILGAAAALRDDLGIELNPHEGRRHDDVIDRLRHALAPDFDRAWQEGGEMTIPDAVTLALESLD